MFVSTYDIIVINGIDRLIKIITNATAEGVHYYVKNEELFDIIHSTHIAIGHGGRDRI